MGYWKSRRKQIQCYDCGCCHAPETGEKKLQGAAMKWRHECRNCQKTWWEFADWVESDPPRKLEGIPPGSTDTSF